MKREYKGFDRPKQKIPKINKRDIVAIIIFSFTFGMGFADCVGIGVERSSSHVSINHIQNTG